jgi:hypothetical protein
MLPGVSQLPAAVILIVAGLVSCFQGRRLFRVLLGLVGFILGALIATSVLAPSTSTATWIAIGVGGMAGALVLIVTYFLGVAFAGAALAALLVHLGFSEFGREPHPFVVVGACVVGALASMAVQNYVIVLASAFGGAWLLVVGGLQLAGRLGAEWVPLKGDVWLSYPLNPSPGNRWVQVVWLVVGVLGAVTQLSIGFGGKARSARRRK